MFRVSGISECLPSVQLSTRILAANMWRSNFHSDPTSQETGLKYRNMILEPGGSQDEYKALVEFLGREPTVEIYLKYLKQQ